MRKLLYIIVMTAACADSGDAADPTEVGTLPAPESAETAVFYERESAAQPDICTLLPNDGSACAHACDPVALASHVPAGTCVTLECPLSDGTSYRTGACNL